MRNIQFISYDGQFPCLCGGTLILNVDGIEVSDKYCLHSGGNAYITKEGDELVQRGLWTVDFERSFVGMDFSEEEQRLITDLVNQNVRHGCCGGCI